VSTDEESIDVPAVLLSLRARVGQHFEAAVERQPGAFRCGAGCADCCRARFSVFAVEAERIEGAVRGLDPSVRARLRGNLEREERADWCPLLVDQRCSIYAERPMICRTHGLPLGVAEGSDALRVVHCELNFVDESFERPSVLRLEAIDQPLAMLAELHAPGAERISLEDVVRAAIGD
jgi:Fe-S-cluster containining protein